MLYDQFLKISFFSTPLQGGVGYKIEIQILPKILSSVFIKSYEAVQSINNIGRRGSGQPDSK